MQAAPGKGQNSGQGSSPLPRTGLTQDTQLRAVGRQCAAAMEGVFQSWEEGKQHARQWGPAHCAVQIQLVYIIHPRKLLQDLSNQPTFLRKFAKGTLVG